MIRWWIAMIIGAVTLSIGYWLGKQRMRGYLKQAEILLDRATEVGIDSQRLLEEAKELFDEQQEQGEDG